MIKVLIADDHAILRHGLKQIIAENDDMIVAGEAENANQAVRLARQGEFDVAVLDVTLPDRSGLDALKLLKKELPKLAVLMLSMHPEEHYALRALRAGASGYLNKQSAPAQLVSAIRQVAAGRKYVSHKLAEELATVFSGDLERPTHATLSDREFQTMRLLASGNTLTQAAETMSLSVKTVSVYRARLLEKMRLKNNAELTRYALEHGLVD